MSCISQDTIYAIHTVYNISEKGTIKNCETGKNTVISKEKNSYIGMYQKGRYELQCGKRRAKRLDFLTKAN